MMRSLVLERKNVLHDLLGRLTRRSHCRKRDSAEYQWSE